VLKIPRLAGVFFCLQDLGKADKAPAISAFTTSLWREQGEEALPKTIRADDGISLDVTNG
jgi:hypothetical protein